MMSGKISIKIGATTCTVEGDNARQIFEQLSDLTDIVFPVKCKECRSEMRFVCRPAKSAEGKPFTVYEKKCLKCGWRCRFGASGDTGLYQKGWEPPYNQGKTPAPAQPAPGTVTAFDIERARAQANINFTERLKQLEDDNADDSLYGNSLAGLLAWEQCTPTMVVRMLDQWRQNCQDPMKVADGISRASTSGKVGEQELSQLQRMINEAITARLQQKADSVVPS